MKKTFQIIGLISLTCFSFFITEKTATVVNDLDEIMIEIKPIEDCLINIIVNYEEDMQLITLNKEVTAIINKHNYLLNFIYFNAIVFII